MSISVINASSQDVGFSEQELKDKCNQCRDESGNFKSEFCYDPISTDALDRFQIYQTSDDGKCYNKDMYEKVLLPTMENPYTRARLVHPVPLKDALDEGQKRNIQLFSDEIQAMRNQFGYSHNHTDKEIHKYIKKRNACVSRLQSYLESNVKIFLKETILELKSKPKPKPKARSLLSSLLITVKHAKDFDVKFLEALLLDDDLFTQYLEGTVRFIRDDDQLQSIMNAIENSCENFEHYIWCQNNLEEIWEVEKLRRRELHL
jgi:hypothetical protein